MTETALRHGQPGSPAGTARPSPARRGRRRATRPPGASRAELRWLLWPPLGFFALALVLPTVALFERAMRGGGSAFAEALALSTFLPSLGRTVVMAIVVTILCLVLGVCYALAIALAPSAVKVILVAGLLISLWTSIMVRTIGWMLIEMPRGALYWAMEVVGIADEPLRLFQTTIGMYPAMVAVMLPFAVLPMMTAFAALDGAQLNAAVVSGSRAGLTFRRIVLPAVAPSAISGAVLVFVLSLGFFVTPLLLGGPANLTVSGAIESQLNDYNRPDLAAAMSIMLVGATIAVYLAADRAFRVSERWG